jgi:hypothetical protein
MEGVPGYWVDEAVFSLRGDRPVCRIRSGSCEFELRGSPETMLAAYESFSRMVAAFQTANGAQVVKLSERGPLFLKDR